MNHRTPADLSGLETIKGQRLEALIAHLSRELLLAEGYPEVQARLMARRIKAQLELEELSHPSLFTRSG